MLDRHEFNLMNRLEETALMAGWCEITKTELLFWFGIDSDEIPPAVWKSIKERLDNMTMEHYQRPHKYLVVEHENESRYLIMMKEWDNVSDLDELVE